MSNINETIQEVADSNNRLSSWIAIVVALSATFMAVCNIKAGNTVQAMSQSQAKSVSKWNQYQSNSMKQNLAETTLALGELQKAPSSVLEHYQNEITRYEQEKKEIFNEATALEKEYQQLNQRDDQFDMSEACLSVALALFGITALIRKRALFFFALVLTCIGIALGLGGFLGWSFQVSWLAKLLG